MSLLLSWRSASMIAALALVGCGAKETPEFGASVVSHYVRIAKAKCAAVGTPDIWECADLGSEHREARLAARTARETYEAFKTGCYEVAGMSKCEAILNASISEADAQR